MEFTYSGYEKLIEGVKKQGFSICSYHDHEKAAKPCILRHDVDYSTEEALKMALVEHEMGVASTYFVLISSPFYNVFAKSTKEEIVRIKDLGHEIGLHFDEMNYEGDIDVPSLIKMECDTLSAALGFPIKSVSMHRPSKATLAANYVIDGVVNSYGEVFFREFKYVSDSRRRWREDPFEAIKKNDKMHILTHAFWYGETEKTIEQTVAEFVNSANKQRYAFLASNITDIQQIMQRESVR